MENNLSRKPYHRHPREFDFETERFYRMRLPHWEVKRGIYFVTLRETGSLPKHAVDELRLLVRECKELRGSKWLEMQRRIFMTMERSLDRPEPKGRIGTAHIATILREAIQNRQRRGVWDMMEYVLMSNHLHLLFRLNSGTLKSTLESFKRYVTREVNRTIATEERDRAASVKKDRLTSRGGRTRAYLWQREWFDHWSRNQNEDERISEYIRQNPVKAKLVANYENWRWGSWNDPELQNLRHSQMLSPY